MLFLPIKMLLLMNFFHSIICDISDDELRKALINAPDGETDLNIVTADWNKFQNEVNINLDLFTSGLASQLDAILFKSNVSEKCHLGMDYLFNQAKSKKTWAVQTLNSWGRWPPSGTFLGTYTSFGSYDQCLAVDTANSTFSTQYCSILMRPLLPHRPRFHNIMNSLPHFIQSKATADDNVIDYFKIQAHWFYYVPLRVGICLTSHCSKHEINRIAQTVSKGVYLQGQAFSCENKQDNKPQFNTHQIVAILFFTCIILATLVGTFVELQHRSNQPVTLSRSLLHAFSIRKNLQLILKTSISQDELKCLHGIRFITISWIVFGHILSMTNYHAFSHSHYYVDINKPFWVTGILNGTLSVDTFFLMSGLLTSYVTWKVTGGDYSKFNWIMFILCRYLRLTPLLVASVCLVFFLPYLGSGPIWHEYIDPIVNNCQSNWWINLFYLQSFVRTDEICLFPSWWISNDTVFHLMSLIIIIPLMLSRKFGLTLNFVMIIGATIIQGIVTCLSDYPPANLPTLPQTKEVNTDLVYNHLWKPLLHAPTFFVGFHLGYILAEQQFPKMSKSKVMLGWTISLITLFASIYSVYPLSIGGDWPRAVDAIFDCTNRTAWALGLSWIIYASAAGYGGFIGNFLSAPFFRPFAKITYSIYLTHMIILWSYMGVRKELLYTDPVTIVYLFFGHWILSLILGLIMALLFESPFLIIQKILADKFMAQKTIESDKDDDNNNTVSLKDWDRKRENKGLQLND